ncbi:hypothetical protein BDN70DRAFT_863489 [Pholiota conissans]|uniref:BTB domain-containing protein n=1 Tax=Pholiota conissans TaxID=109636 RepID=A0A9P5YVN2_9AGAR|nr:hypothetical protein BDN70DRAFT_863489 [Pholiota conissans]
MGDNFAQGTTPLGPLRAILGSYPFSVGLLREMLQNSEDAKALVQTFALDRRSHPSASLYHPNLAATQGPALLAFNDANFNEADWHALQFVYESSKADDSSKIGKYGVGFRSVFHITDCPQIVSGNTFAMFDPLQEFTGSAGKRLDLTHVTTNHPDQLASFSHFVDPVVYESEFPGTVIRCPLRRIPSRIDAKVVSPDEIARLFREFIFREMDISLLFLQHVQQIQVYGIDEQGAVKCLAQLSISRSPRISLNSVAEAYTATVSITIDGKTEDRRWRIIQCAFEQEDAIKILCQGSSDLTSRILKEHKLLPTVGIAMPLSSPTDGKSGRLFTFLPLPLPTGFPVHVHAYFALTQSRQNLRNSRETGLGSSDLILVQWNKLLFDRYIPQAWRLMLEILAEQDAIHNIFMAWPPEQRSPVTSGENVYWKHLPDHTLNSIISAKSAIWPVYQLKATPTTPEFRPLNDVITADPAVPDIVLDALTTVGLKLTRPPQYIVDLIKGSGNESIRILTPNEAHRALQDHVAEVQAANDVTVQIILGYLLSTYDVRNITGLPLIKLATQQRVILLAAEDTTTRYTMLNRAEYDVFRLCDDDAIPLHLLPINIAEIIRTHGPGIINVEIISVPRIVKYLEVYPSKLNLDLSFKTDPTVRKWLAAFWLWQHTYPHRQDLYASIRHLFLLPSTKGLRKADSPLFKSFREHPVTVKHLQTIGVPFLDPEFQESAQNILMSYDIVKPITNIHALLDSLISPSDDLKLSKEACTSILGHISTYMAGSCNINGPLNDDRVRLLRTLPIFPIVEFPPNGQALTTQWAALPPSSKIRNVTIRGFIPVIPGYTFIQVPPPMHSFMDYIEASHPKHLRDVDLLSLTVNHFTEQPDHVQAASLKYMSNQWQLIPPHVIATLERTSFVAVQDGSRKKPSEVVEPDSPIYRLYADNPERKIRQSSPSDDLIMRALRSLKLLKYSLTIDVVQETIEAISSRTDTSRKWVDLSVYLISLMAKTNLDYTKLRLTPEQEWLPTDQGLRGFADCRDHDPSIAPRNLFDKALAVFQPLKIPASLKQALKWDQPLTTEILIDQLDRTLSFNPDDCFSVVFDILKEIGSRTLSKEELSELRMVTQSRRWVPTTDRQLSETVSAVFSQPLAESGFSQIYHIDELTRDFLRSMGCQDRPSTRVILNKLEALDEQDPSLNVVNAALNLIRSLPPNLTDEERSELLIPDVDNRLRPFFDTFFNDIGDQAQLIPNNEDFVSHPLIDESLARNLGLGRLGLKYADIVISGVEMGEKPIITVRKTLSQYTDTQFAIEFLANAADANATEFSLLVNEFRGDSTYALSPLMAKFITSPSLIVHNDAMFTDEDFTGICRTSVGGKQNKRETIGQFGLGALTMFHFTELAIVVSNTRVLFLNPSESHLPIRDSAALMMSLNHVRKFYSSHLAAIDGLFGFSLSNEDPYNGTIFLLPLREDAHLNVPDCISRSSTWTAKDVERKIVQAFSASASDSLLFTRMSRISGSIRDFNGDFKECWSFSAVRTGDPPDGNYSISDIDIMSGHSTSTASWKVATVTVPETDIPGDLHTHAIGSRLRLPPIAGLALRLDDDAVQKDVIYRLFSTLPLAISTTMPVHVMASFILASDRRSIRMDDYNGPETRYNKWLLSAVIPPLYCFLLEHIVIFGEPELKFANWWPRRRVPDDAFSRIIVDTFYNEFNLKNDRRKLLRSSYSSLPLAADDAVLLSGKEPESIQAVLSDLEPDNIVQLPWEVYDLATDHGRLSKVTPAFLREELLRDSSFLVQSNIDVIQDVITYLSSRDSGGAPSNLYDLPILPLDDRDIGYFRDATNPMQYFKWPSQSIPHNFPSGCFVHSQLRLPSFLSSSLNVKLLDAAGIRRFIEEKLSNVPRNTLPPETRVWIPKFWNAWKVYVEQLKLQPHDIAEYPLVPTVNPAVFVSLNQCKEGGVLLVGGNHEAEESLRATLDRLGLIVVRLDQEPTPENLRDILRNEGEYPPLNFLGVLAALASHHDYADRLRDLEDDTLAIFADWARHNIREEAIPPNLLPVAKQLPIWHSLKRGFPEKLRSAAEVFMLPHGLHISKTGPFMRKFVSSYGRIRFLEPNALSFEEVEGLLELPSIMERSDLRLYKGFLRDWVLGLPQAYRQPIRIPNANGIVVPSNELYARTDLFQSIFGADSERFVASELAEVENMLYKHGLRYDALLDVPTFQICADAVLAQPDEHQADRAAILFRAYCQTLPMQIGANDHQTWIDLDQIRFVPRNLSTERRLDGQDAQQTGLLIPNNIVDLPSIVSPSQTVREEFEAIAWTQRALFREQPHQRVLIANPSLGLPHISEVILHLKVLASLSSNASRQQKIIILHDLQQTYAFLANKTSVMTSEDINQLSTDNIFLNVDDPDTEVWHWDNRDHLVFETQDTGGSYRYVRDFLRPYEPLLRSAGVLEVYHPEYLSDHIPSSDALKLGAIRNGFDALRREGILTDVIFIPNGVNDSDNLAAHRAFLAVVSEYFNDMFTGGYKESRAATPQDPVEFPVPDCSALCIESILDYIYTGLQSLQHDAPLDLLLEIMQLSSYWRINDLFEDMQREIVNRRLINPLTLEQIRTIAEGSNAQNLLRNCTEYEEINAAFIEKVRQTAGLEGSPDGRDAVE